MTGKTNAKDYWRDVAEETERKRAKEAEQRMRLGNWTHRDGSRPRHWRRGKAVADRRVKAGAQR